MKLLKKNYEWISIGRVSGFFYKTILKLSYEKCKIEMLYTYRL